MTLPIPSNVFSDGQLINEAALYANVFAPINTIYATLLSQPGGLVGTTTGPGVQVDFTTQGNAISTSFSLVNGHNYLVIASILGVVITNPGTPQSLLIIGGVTQSSRLITGALTWPSNGLGVGGTAVQLYTAASTGSTAFLVTGADPTASSAYRVAANQAQLTVLDMGL